MLFLDRWLRAAATYGRLPLWMKAIILGPLGPFFLTLLVVCWLPIVSLIAGVAFIAAHILIHLAFPELGLEMQIRNSAIGIGLFYCAFAVIGLFAIVEVAIRRLFARLGDRFSGPSGDQPVRARERPPGI
jgi:hypothetical protein